MRAVWLAVILNSIAPVLYLLVVYFGLYQYNYDAQEAGFADVFAACRDARLSGMTDCAELLILDNARSAAVIALLAGLALPFLLFFVPQVLGRSRVTLALFFPLALPITVLASLAISISSVVLVGFAAHVLTTWTFQIIWPYLYVVLALGGLLLVGAVVMSFATVFQSTAHQEFGTVVTKKELPELFFAIESLAKRMKVKKPKNVVLGNSPNFYITNARVQLRPGNRTLTGETVFLSATLCRLLKNEEVEAIIAHELMHYKGSDLTFTKVFVPIYKVLAGLMTRLESDENGASLPLLLNVAPLHEGFSSAERRISRERELAADRGAAVATGALPLASALSKVTVFHSAWDLALRDNADALRIGEYSVNAVASVYGYVVYECSRQFVDDQFDTLSTQRFSHPTDTHPTMQDRFKNLGVRISDIPRPYFDAHEPEQGFLTQLPSAVVDQLNAAFIYETLSNHHVQLPADDEPNAEHDRIAYRLLYQLLVHFIRADGKVLPEEVKAAEASGYANFSGFNPLLFREYLHGQEELLPLQDLANYTVQVFNNTGIKNVEGMLRSVIEADLDVAPEEQKLFDIYISEVRRHQQELANQ